MKLIFLMILSLPILGAPKTCLEKFANQVFTADDKKQGHKVFLVKQFIKEKQSEINQAEIDLVEVKHFLRAITYTKKAAKKFLTKEQIQKWEDVILSQFPTLSIHDQLEVFYSLSHAHRSDYTKQLAHIAAPVFFSDHYLSQYSLKELYQLLLSYERYQDALNDEHYSLWLKYASFSLEELNLFKQVSFDGILHALSLHHERIKEHEFLKPFLAGWFYQIQQGKLERLAHNKKEEMIVPIQEINIDRLIGIFRSFYALKYKLDPINRELLALAIVKNDKLYKTNRMPLLHMTLMMARMNFSFVPQHKVIFFKKMTSWLKSDENKPSQALLDIVDTIGSYINNEQITLQNFAVEDLLNLVQQLSLNTEIPYLLRNHLYQKLHEIGFPPLQELREMLIIELKAGKNQKYQEHNKALRSKMIENKVIL